MFKSKSSLIITFLLLPVCLLAGLSTPFFALAICGIIIFENYQYINLEGFKEILFTHYPMILFLLWMLLSCLWSPVSEQAIILNLKIIAMFVISLLTKQAITLSPLNPVDISSDSIKYKSDNLKSILSFLSISLVITLCIYYIELRFNGLFLKTYSIAFNDASNQFQFVLYKLDRGCAVLSIITWVIIGYLLSRKQFFLSLVTYLAVLFLLMTSDSLASEVATICSFLCFSMMILTKGRILPLFKYGIFIGSILFVCMIYYISPEEVITKFGYMPESAKHRIYIWNYVAKIFQEHKILGFGLDASRYISKTFAEYILYKDTYWSLLPLHPHNVILQTLLELGITGLSLLFLVISNIFKNIQKISNPMFQAIALTMFIQYFIIGMISFGMWQQWWIAAAVIAYVYWSILYKVKG